MAAVLRSDELRGADPALAREHLAPVVDGGRAAAPGSESPIASPTAAIVFAVYIPAHEPVRARGALDPESSGRRRSFPSRARRRPRTRPGS